MIYACLAIAAIIFGVLVPRPGMRMLTKLCPTYFRRLRWYCEYDLLKEALWDYSESLDDGEAEERDLHASWLRPLIVTSVLCALVPSEVAALFTNISSFACILLALIGSLLPFLFGLLLLGLGKLVITWHQAAWGDPPEISDTDRVLARFREWDGYNGHWEEDQRYTIFDCLWDLREDIKDAFKKSPEEALAIIDRPYNRVRAWLSRSSLRSMVDRLRQYTRHHRP